MNGVRALIAHGGMYILDIAAYGIEFGRSNILPCSLEDRYKPR